MEDEDDFADLDEDMELSDYKQAADAEADAADEHIAEVKRLQEEIAIKDKMLNSMSQKISDLMDREKLLEKENAKLRDEHAKAKHNYLCEHDERLKLEKELLLTTENLKVSRKENAELKASYEGWRTTQAILCPVSRRSEIKPFYVVYPLRL